MKRLYTLALATASLTFSSATLLSSGNASACGGGGYYAPPVQSHAYDVPSYPIHTSYYTTRSYPTHAHNPPVHHTPHTPGASSVTSFPTPSPPRPQVSFPSNSFPNNTFPNSIPSTFPQVQQPNFPGNSTGGPGNASGPSIQLGQIGENSLRNRE
ncbi:hypothetical protein [Aporhodopirellula aestuarii]|uniref:Secreted protein n=1 Tax=Aporhodopirellula aestuarii TaxID=2950107 RepID=A0ABT0U6V5_9BACT|nr:hypothetical protein [Aporhodopirellula aestuarii]MCM2372682.1 hypothetical protein [Aporhodopirellula aestuarii]